MSRDEDSRKTSERAVGVSAAATLVKEHAPLMGRVAMALLADASAAEKVLEQVAHEAGAKGVPDGVRPAAWLLGLVRTASAVQLSKLPRRMRSDEGAPATERMGAAAVAGPARAALFALKPTEREAVVLALVGGLAAEDLATACQVDVATVKARLGRALEQLLTMKGDA